MGEMPDLEGVVVGRVEDLPPGGAVVVPVGKFGIGVFNVAGSFYALTNYCLHRGAPMCLGSVSGTALPGKEPYEAGWAREGEVLRCPWHGWEFDITNGKSLAFPKRGIRTYPVEVEDGWIVIRDVPEDVARQRPDPAYLPTGVTPVAAPS